MKGKSKFVRIKCGKCKNEQVIFEKATTPVKCLSCGATIGTPAGGKIQIDGRVVEVLN